VNVAVEGEGEGATRPAEGHAEVERVDGGGDLGAVRPPDGERALGEDEA
jgi:hypothetical protein